MVFIEFLALLIVIGAVVAVVYGVNWGRGRLDRNRSDALELRQQVHECQRQLNKAEHTLRTIANGCGAPELEAQIALDEITKFYEKELS